MELLGEVVQDISKVETNLGCRNHRLQRRLLIRHNLVRSGTLAVELVVVWCDVMESNFI